MAATQSSKAKLDADFSDLYRNHLKDVYSYSYYRVGNHHDAEDLTEQTFLQADRHLDRALAESPGRPLRPWGARWQSPHAGPCARGSSGSRTSSPRTFTGTGRAGRRRRSTTRTAR